MEDEIIENKKEKLYKEVPYITNMRHFIQVAGIYGFRLVNNKFIKYLTCSDSVITVIVNYDGSIKYLQTITTARGTPIETEVDIDKDDQLWIFKDMDYLLKLKKEEICLIAKR